MEVFDEMFWTAERGPRSNQLNYGGDPNHDPDTEIF